MTENQIIFKKEVRPFSCWWYLLFIIFFMMTLNNIYTFFYPTETGFLKLSDLIFEIIIFIGILKVISDHFTFALTEIDNVLQKVVIRKKSFFGRTVNEYSFSEISRFNAVFADYEHSAKSWLILMKLNSGKDVYLPGTVNQEQIVSEETAERLTADLFRQLKAHSLQARKLKP